VADRLHPAQIQVPSERKIRMVDFETGKADLRLEHRAWLDDTARFLGNQGDYWVYIYGFASKLPPHGARNADESSHFNRELSYARASAVARYLEKKDSRVSSRIREFSARGSDDYNAPKDDNSADARAVEVHVHLSPVAPPPPVNADPLPSLPGGARYSSWSVASPFGATVTVLPLVVAAANVVVFRCKERRNETHPYLAPGVGGGFSYTGPKLSKLKDLIKNMLGNFSYSGMSFTDVTAITPFNFRDLDGATCDLLQASAGAGPGYQQARVSAHGQVWYRDSNGKPFFGMRDFVTNVDVSGKDLQLGVGASAVGGPLLRID
jgi:hypothetical protein